MNLFEFIYSAVMPKGLPVVIASTHSSNSVAFPEDIATLLPVESNAAQAWLVGLLYDPMTAKVIFSLLLFVGLRVVIGFVQSLASRQIEENDLRYRVRKILDIVFFIAFAIALTVVFSDRLGNVTVAFGLAGAGVALALQEMIASVASWFSITFGHTFRSGDRITFDNICGDVIDIGLTRTTLMECGGWVDGDLYTGRIVRVANNALLKEPLYNYNMDFPFLWDEIVFPIKYGSDIQVARAIFESAAERVVGEYSRGAQAAWQQIVKRYRIENARVDPLITLSADENWISITVRYVVDYQHRRSTKDKLYMDILEQIEQSNGQVQVAGAAIDITAMPPIHVEVSSSHESQ